ncbi:MAG: DUF3362 domain-containing protein, partial [Burkholderiaceae bacterium]
RGEKRRRLHKAFLRYHDPNNWPLLRDALKAMGRSDLIGNGKVHLIPSYQPLSTGEYVSARRKNSTPAHAKSGTGSSGKIKLGKTSAVQPRAGRLLTQHTGLPPRAGTRASGSASASNGPTTGAGASKTRKNRK